MKMKELKLKLTKKQKANIFNEDEYLEVEGSAGSGKTRFACSKIIVYCLQYKRAKAYVFRETLKACRETCWETVLEILDESGIPYKANKSSNKIFFPNGSRITFLGLDNKDKIRSINADIIYVEQTEETKFESFIELKARIRSKVSKKYYGQLITVTTPEEETHWLYNFFHREKRGTVLHFHYKDNPFLPQSFIDYLESLKEIDEEIFLQLTEGKWGQLTDIIFTKWDNKLSKKGYSYYTIGVDFGYNNPACMLLTGWLDSEPYIIDEVYKSHLTNSEFIDLCKECLKNNDLTTDDLHAGYYDTNRPEYIVEFENAGFPSNEVDKSVKAGIDNVKRVTTHVAKHCLNFIKEIKSYKWKKDRNGDPTDEPVKVNDHAMDAHRYNVYGELGALNNDKKDSDVDYDYFNRLNNF